MDETPANRVPDNIVTAARRGDADAVRRWLVSGGDPNWDLVDPNSHGFPSHYRLLMFTTEWNVRDVMRLLISHGADVNYKYFYGRDPDVRQIHDDYAWKSLDMAFYKNNAESARLLLDNGANISRLNSSAWARILAHPRLLRIVLAAGADFTASCVDGMTPEDSARVSIAAVRSYNSNRAAIFEETASILEGARLAGSYKQYVLQDYKHLLRLRSLLARGRALLGPQTPEVVKRLFGGRVDAWATFPHQRLVGVPDPAFWLVMEYWRLGDWRRPRA